MITHKCLWFCAALFAFPYLASASSITTGSPDFYGAGLSPTFGTLINFDSLIPMSNLDPAAFASIGVSSIVNNPAAAALIAYPFSQQSEPIEITTGPSDNYAGDMTITFSDLSNQVGIGIAEDGATQTTFTVYGDSNKVLSNFVETVPSSTFNAYYVISDPSYDIRSIEINSAQNLAIDDLQFTATTPEPVSVSFAAVGLMVLVGLWRRKAS